MSDFESALQSRLSANEKVAERRAEFERDLEEQRRQEVEEAERREAELVERRRERHGELAEHLTKLASQVQQTVEDVVVRTGWTESGEELLARFSTQTLSPTRSLTIELDRDDDEVLARWHTGVGDALEHWHLLDFDTDMLERLVLQVVDEELWSGRTTTPPFPGNPEDTRG